MQFSLVNSLAKKISIQWIERLSWALIMQGLVLRLKLL